MTTIEIEQAAPPLKPGQTGMKTNGPVAWWFRVDGGDWLPCDRAHRSGYKLKQGVIELLQGKL